MAMYRVYYCTSAGAKFATEDVDAKSDAEAIAHMRRLAILRVPAFEIWQDDRLVHQTHELIG